MRMLDIINSLHFFSDPCNKINAFILGGDGNKACSQGINAAQEGERSTREFHK